MLNGITSFNNFESEISMNPIYPFCFSHDRLVPCSMSNIGTLSHTYHTATYTVGCGVGEREPAEKSHLVGTPRTFYCKFDHKSSHIFYFKTFSS